MAEPSPANLSPADQAEVLRLHDGGMGLDALGAQFRKPYGQIARVISAELQRRADAWASHGPSLGWPERDEGLNL